MALYKLGKHNKDIYSSDLQNARDWLKKITIKDIYETGIVEASDSYS